MGLAIPVSQDVAMGVVVALVQAGLALMEAQAASLAAEEADVAAEVTKRGATEREAKSVCGHIR